MDAGISNLITIWKAEYERVNAKPAPDVFYHRGWFTIQLSKYGTKYRRADVYRMIDRLSQRPDGGGAK